MNEPQSETPAPKNKGGRPKGSKNRPKWILDELKKAPKRPRGRPKGSKNKPKTLEGLIELSLTPPIPPPKPEKPKRKRERQGYHGTPREAYFARLKREDPEKLAEISSRASRSPARREKRATIPPGTPLGFTMHEWALRKDEARKIAHRIFKLMDKEGALPENPIAREAMKTALEMLAEDNSSKDKLAIIRTLLEYNLAKPAATQNVNIKTAEDFLDELASEDASTA
jgi:hypothetical protein